MKLSAAKIKLFFINYLNRVYCAKSHLHERLPEIQELATFNDLSAAIAETLTDVEQQISRMDTIYDLLKVKPVFEKCEGMIALIEEAFSAIHDEPQDPESRDLAILFYVQNIESIEATSFKMLNLAAPLLHRKIIRQLLRENFDEASEDLALLRLITARYFSPKIL